jgi:virginiamycin B lyase
VELSARRIVTVMSVIAVLLLGACSSPADVTAGQTQPAPPPSAPASPTDDPDVAPTAEPDVAEPTEPQPLADPVFEEFDVPAGSRPHDVAPGPDGRVWYSGQGSGELGMLNPETGRVRTVPLGAGSSPHGVIVGPDGTPWLTDGGLNAIVAVDPQSFEVTTYPLRTPSSVNLNTATFAGDGQHWFTGQAGVHGRVDPRTGEVAVFDSPRGTGPYGIATTPDGEVWFSSLAGSYIAHVTDRGGSVAVVDTPSPNGGARRVWSDSRGRLWVTEWFAGNLARYNPATSRWRTWRLPGDEPQPYAVYVDEDDIVWVTDFGADALVRFDPRTEEFRSFPWPTPDAAVRQLLGRPGEIWGAGSATDTLIVLRTR